MKQTTHCICKPSLLVILLATLVFQGPVWAVESEDGKGASDVIKELEHMYFSFIETGEVVEDTKGRNIVHIAVLYRRFGVMSLLQKNDCPQKLKNDCLQKLKGMINARDKHGNTPVMYAVEQDNPEVMTSLTRLFVECEDGKTPLMCAAKDGDLKMAKKLINYCSVYAEDNQGKTALMYAAKKGHINVVQLFYDRTENAESGNARLINARDANNKTALMYATEAYIKAREFAADDHRNFQQTVMHLGETSDQKNLNEVIVKLKEKYGDDDSLVKNLSYQQNKTDPNSVYFSTAE